MLYHVRMTLVYYSDDDDTCVNIYDERVDAGSVEDAVQTVRGWIQEHARQYYSPGTIDLVFAEDQNRVLYVFKDNKIVVLPEEKRDTLPKQFCSVSETFMTLGGAGGRSKTRIPGLTDQPEPPVKKAEGNGMRLDIIAPAPGTMTSYWGVFEYGERMPWGPWHLTSQPKVLYIIGPVMVLECYADEIVEDENGVAVSGTNYHDPKLRHFIVGRKGSGQVLWWHQLSQEFDSVAKKYAETSITYNNDGAILVKGYEGNGKGQGKVIRIDLNTGEKTVQP